MYTRVFQVFYQVTLDDSYVHFSCNIVLHLIGFAKARPVCIPERNRSPR